MLERGMESARAVVVVGYGHWGKNLARVFRELGALRGVVDTQTATRERAIAELPGYHVWENLPEALAATDSSVAVVVATPAATHFSLTSHALEAGRDVFVEKPMALEASSGRALSELAKRKGRVLMVGHLLLYHPAARALADLVRSGALGKLLYIYSNRLNWGRFRREENILWSFAPHDVALLLELAGEMPTAVAAHGSHALHPTIADVTVSHLHFSSGLKAHIHVSWLHPFKEQRLVVVGDRGLAVFEDTAAPGERLVIFEHGIDWVDRVPIARTANRRAIPFEPEEPLVAECRAFLLACTSRIPPLSSGDSGVAVLDVLEACQRSVESDGSRVNLRPATSSDLDYSAHPSAVVDPSALVGRGAKIWHFSHIMAGAILGERVVVGQNAFIAAGVRVGAGSKLQNNVSLYKGVELEEDVFVGPSAVFTNVRHPRAHVERKSEYERTLVKRGASIGANATIRCGIEIGEYAVVGAGALVTRDVPAHCVVIGAPARVAGWACACGETLYANDAEMMRCERCTNVYMQRGDGGLVSIDAPPNSDASGE